MTTTEEREPALSPGLDRAFRISLWLKAIDGVLEVIGGILLFFVAPSTLDDWVRWAVAHDLAGSPHDWVAQHLLNSASALSTSSTTFGAVYLLVHGGAKLVLVVLLLRRKLWAYPWMIGLLLLFVAYQMYRFVEKPGIGMILLSAFDLFVAWLTWREYRARTVLASPRAAIATAGSGGVRDICVMEVSCEAGFEDWPATDSMVDGACCAASGCVGLDVGRGGHDRWNLGAYGVSPGERPWCAGDSSDEDPCQ